MTSQALIDRNLVRLQSAVLCANCEVISEGVNGHCAGCGSQSLLNLSSVLGGPIDAELSIGLEAPAVNEVYVYSLSAAA